MANPGLALHKALISTLESLTTVTIYDAVPQDASYPYVVLDSDQVINEDFLNQRMDRRFIYLSIWSRAYGSAEVKTIIAELDAINETPMTLDTGEVVSVRVERTHTNREPDNLTFMGHITLRVITLH